MTFDLHIGIDFSGRGTLVSRTSALQVYAASGHEEPQAVRSRCQLELVPQGDRRVAHRLGPLQGPLVTAFRACGVRLVGDLHELTPAERLPNQGHAPSSKSPIKYRGELELWLHRRRVAKYGDTPRDPLCDAPARRLLP
jgi:hypothetical protein